VKIEGSAHLAQAEYDLGARELRIQFHNGKTHAYLNVPPETWVEFQDADSKGKYFNQKILPNFHSFPRPNHVWKD
jgi:KTSC domain